MLLLKILSEGDYYGYEIILILRKISKNIINITAGSIYPVLYKLQEKGYVVSYTQNKGLKMERVYYHLTQEGKEYLRDIVQDYYTVENAINAVLEFKAGQETKVNWYEKQKLYYLLSKYKKPFPKSGL